MFHQLSHQPAAIITQIITTQRLAGASDFFYMACVVLNTSLISRKRSFGLQRWVS